MDGLGAVSAGTDSHGVYAFPALPEGNYTVVSSAVGFRGQTVNTAIPGFGVTTLDFDLAPEGVHHQTNINGAGGVDAVDVQLVINAALGLDIGGLDADINNDGGVNAMDVQLVINAALGLKRASAP